MLLLIFSKHVSQNVNTPPPPHPPNSNPWRCSCGQEKKAGVQAWLSYQPLCSVSVSPTKKHTLTQWACPAWCSHGPEELNSDGPLRNLQLTDTLRVTLTATCLCAESVVFREKGNKNLGKGFNYIWTRKVDLEMLQIFVILLAFSACIVCS